MSASTLNKMKEEMRTFLKEGKAKTESSTISSMKNQMLSGMLYADYKKKQEKLDYYNSLKQNPDWEEKSKISALDDLFASRWPSPFDKDKQGNYRYEVAEVIDAATEEETAIYNYLYQTDREKAREYFYDIQGGLKQANIDKFNQDLQKWADKNEFAGSAASVVTAIGSGAEGLMNLGEGVFNAIRGNGFTFDTTDDYMTHATNALREGASADMNVVGKFLYGTGMSILDNLARAPLGPAGAGLMAMGQAASQGMVQGKEMGMADWKAALYGITVGGIEGVTEAVSVDKLLDKTNLAKSVKGYILKNVIAEGSEEALSEVADKTAQFILAGDEAEWRKEYAAYISQGYSKSEAIGLVVANTVGDVGLAALSGALSGGGMAGGGVAINTAVNAPKNVALGREVAAGANSTSELLAAAEAAKSKRIDNTARKMANAKTEIGRDYQRGKLTQQVMAEAYEKLHPYGLETETKDNGKLTHDAKVAQKKLDKANKKRTANGQQTIAEEFEQSDFGQKYSTFKKKIKNYEDSQRAGDALAKKGKINADQADVYNVSDDGKTYLIEKDEQGKPTLKETEVTEFSGVEGGIAQLKLSDGSVVSAKDVSLPADLAKQYKLAASYNDTAVAKAFLDGYSSYDGTIEAYAEEVKTAYLLGKEAGERGISDMIKTLPKAKQNSIVKNPATATAFDAGKARAKKQAEDSAKMKKVREAKNSRSEGDIKSKDNVFNSLDAYNSEEIASIKRDSQNQIAKSLEDIKTFITSSINGEIRGRLFIGKLKSDTSAKIKKDTGVSTDGYSVIITSDEIKHLFNQHGDAKKEELRGQEAITLDNITSVFDAIFNPDTVSVETDNNGVVSLVFKRTNNGTITAVTIASVKKKALTLKSARITKKKQHISPLSDVQASNPTSKNERSMNTVSTDSISEKSEKVNTSDEKTSAKKGKKSKKRSKGSFTISEEVDTNNLTPTQKKAIKRLEILSKCLDNVDIVVVDEGVGNATGKYQGKNGWYDPNTDTMYVSITAGRGNVNDIGDYAIVETLSHEVVHFVKEHSEADYEKLKSFLQKNVYTAEQWNNLVLGRLEQYKFTYESAEEKYKAAEEEVVANACQTMLNSPRVLSALARGNYSLFERIKFRIADFFDNLIEKLGSNVFYTSEARLVLMSTQKMRRELEKKFIEAVRQARSNSQSSKNSQTESSTAKTAKSDIKYSLRETLKSLGEYDATRVRHIESSGKDRVARDYDEIIEFIRSAKNNQPFERLHIGIIGDNTASLVKSKTGIDVKGFDFVLASNFVFHIYNSHGNEAAEASRGQKAVDDISIENIIETVITPDDVSLVSDSTGTALRFEKLLDGRNVAITITSTKKSTLTLKSAWIINEKSGGRTPSANANALAGTPEANSRNSTTNSIPDNSEKSNSFSKNSEEKSSERTTNAISTRDMILDAFAMEDLNGSELRSVNAYRNRIKRIDELVERRAAINRELTELMNKKGSEAASRRSELRVNRDTLSRQIAREDELLFKQEKTKYIQKVASEVAVRRIENAIQNQNMEEVKRYSREAIDRYEKRIAALRKSEEEEQVKEAVKAYRESRKIKLTEKELVEKLTKIYKKYYNLLKHPTDKNYVPPQLVKSVCQILELLDFDTGYYETRGKKTGKGKKTRDLRLEMRAALGDFTSNITEILKRAEAIKGDDVLPGAYDLLSMELDDNLIYDATELSKIIGEKRVKDLTADELQMLYNILKQLDDTVINARKLITSSEYEEAQDAANAIAEEQKKIAKAKKSNKVLSAIDKAISCNTLDPMDNVLIICDHDETSPLYQVFKALNEGHKHERDLKMLVFKELEKVTVGKENEKSLKNSRKAIDVKFSTGDTVKMSEMSIISALLSIKSEDSNPSTHHIFGKDGKGVLMVADAKSAEEGLNNKAVQNCRPVKITRSDVSMLEERLSEWSKRYMESVQKSLALIGDAINKTSLEAKGYLIATMADYFPFIIDKDYLVREISDNDVVAETVNSYGPTHSRRPGASEPLIIMNADTVLNRHLDKMSKFVGLCAPVQDFNRMWNSTVTDANGNKVLLKRMLKDIHGKERVNVVEQAIKDLQSTRRDANPDNIVSAALKKLNDNFAPAVLMANISSTLKQPSAIYSANTILNHRSAVAVNSARVKAVVGMKGGKIYETIDKYTSCLWERRQGLSTRELGDIATQIESSFLLRQVKKLPSWVNGASWLQTMDVMNATAIWLLAEEDIKATGTYQEGSEEYYRAVANLFENVMEKTQVTYDVLHRSELMKTNNQLVRGVLAFQNETFKQFGQVYMAFRGLAAAYHSGDSVRISSAWKHLGKTLGAMLRTLVSLVLFTLAGKAILHKEEYFENDDGEITAGSILKASAWEFGSGASGFIMPLIGTTVFDFIENAITGSYGYDAFSVPSVSAANAFLNSLKSVFRGDFTFKKIENLLFTTLETIQGVPATNYKNIVKAIMDWIKTWLE